MFTRSNNGLGNRALFTRARFTVYVENDPTCDPTRAVDVAFWREFFGHFFPHIEVSFARLGGKEQVLKMAQKIIAASIPNCLCAVDSDYDRHFSRSDKDERIFHSFGYGVENDLLNEFSTIGILRAILPGLEKVDDQAKEVWRFVVDTVRLEYLALVSDQIARARGESILERKKPQSDLVHDSDLPVRFRREKIRSEMKRVRNLNITPQIRFTPKVAPSLVPAHHFMEIVYQTFCRFVKKHTRTRFSHVNFLAICLGSIQNALFNFMPQDILNHYQDLGARNIEKYSSI